MMRRLLVVIVMLAGCEGAQQEGRVSALNEVIKTARANGAYKCAPRELAMAESHTAFGEEELKTGNFYRAQEELDIADKNAKAAVEKSPKDKCNPDVAVAQTDTHKIVVTVQDTDGDGLNDDVDKCPKDPEDKDGYQDEDGCPDPDNDGDGILDAADKCPLDPEDIDKFEDDDGCPEPDNDQDGLADKIDKCPDNAEDKDGFEDEDGCPDPDNDKDAVLDPVDKCPNEYAQTPDGCPQKYKLVVVTSEKIEIKQTVYFDFMKAKIKPVSFPLLDEVAQALQDNPNIKVEVQGHTDSVGDDKFNMKLSQWRAESVKKYLVSKGVAEDRMTAKGYGETVPIADNRTSDGRDQNRRVEFVITSQ